MRPRSGRPFAQWFAEGLAKAAWTLGWMLSGDQAVLCLEEELSHAAAGAGEATAIAHMRLGRETHCHLIGGLGQVSFHLHAVMATLGCSHLWPCHNHQEILSRAGFWNVVYKHLECTLPSGCPCVVTVHSQRVQELVLGSSRFHPA